METLVIELEDGNRIKEKSNQLNIENDLITEKLLQHLTMKTTFKRIDLSNVQIIESYFRRPQAIRTSEANNFNINTTKTKIRSKSFAEFSNSTKIISDLEDLRIESSDEKGSNEVEGKEEESTQLENGKNITKRDFERKGKNQVEQTNEEILNSGVDPSLLEKLVKNQTFWVHFWKSVKRQRKWKKKI